MKACQILKVNKTKGVCNNEGYWILQTQTHIHTHTHTHTYTKEPFGDEQLHELP